MKKIVTVFLLIIVCLFAMGCDESTIQDRAVIEEQQQHYQKVHPVPYFEYSIPRDVLIQIYEAVTTKAYTTYTVIESITGETKFHGPSVGYGIPVDTQLTNPLMHYSQGGIIEQPEPNGVFSSKNTDGTWVLFLLDSGQVVPIYTEHKVTTFPFPVEQTEAGEWVRKDSTEVLFEIEID